MRLMTRHAIACFWIGWNFLALSAFGDIVFVDKVKRGEGVDVDPGTVQELLKTFVSELGHSQAESAAGAQFTLRASLHRLGEAYVIKIDKLRHSRFVFSTQGKTIEREELDLILKNLTRAVIEERAAVPMVADAGGEMVRDGRRSSQRGYAFALGPALLTNLGTSTLGYSFSIAKAFHVDRAVVEIFGDLSGQGTAFFTDFGLSTRFFFLNKETQPFVGAGLSFAFARTADDSPVGGRAFTAFALTPAIGVQFFRSSDIQVEFSLRVAVLLAEGPLGVPTCSKLQLGLFF